MFGPRKRGMKGEIIDLPEGYSWLVGKSTHVNIICPDGSKLRTESGIPLGISLTPSDKRTRKNEESRIRKALQAKGVEL